MDEKQLQYEFLSILSESHPGLTFEVYRDSCVFLSEDGNTWKASGSFLFKIYGIRFLFFTSFE